MCWVSMPIAVPNKDLFIICNIVRLVRVYATQSWAWELTHVILASNTDIDILLGLGAEGCPPVAERVRRCYDGKARKHEALLLLVTNGPGCEPARFSVP